MTLEIPKQMDLQCKAYFRSVNLNQEFVQTTVISPFLICIIPDQLSCFCSNVYYIPIFQERQRQEDEARRRMLDEEG